MPQVRARVLSSRIPRRPREANGENSNLPSRYPGCIGGSGSIKLLRWSSVRHGPCTGSFRVGDRRVFSVRAARVESTDERCPESKSVVCCLGIPRGNWGRSNRGRDSLCFAGHSVDRPGTPHRSGPMRYRPPRAGHKAYQTTTYPNLSSPQFQRDNRKRSLARNPFGDFNSITPPSSACSIRLPVDSPHFSSVIT